MKIFSTLGLIRGLVCSVALTPGAHTRSLKPIPCLRGTTVLRRRRSWNSCMRRRRAARNFVPPEERIATFDQDGTLWVEHPMYSQVMYCLDRVPAWSR